MWNKKVEKTQSLFIGNRLLLMGATPLPKKLIKPIVKVKQGTKVIEGNISTRVALEQNTQPF